MWTIIFTKQAVKDAKKIKDHNLKPKVQKLLQIIETNPFQNPPHFEKLIGDLNGAYSRRINIQHRLCIAKTEFIISNTLRLIEYRKV